MAGMVGMVGAVAGGAFLGVENKRAKAKELEREALEERRHQERLDAMSKSTEVTPEEVPEPVAAPEPEAPEFDDKGNVISGSGSETGKSDDKPKPDTSSDTTYTPNPGTGNMSPEFKKIYDLAVKDGRSKFPEIVAAQAMHETGHLNPNITSVYNSSGGTNPFGQTGDRGYGTMTRDGDPSGWSSFPDLQT